MREIQVLVKEDISRESFEELLKRRGLLVVKGRVRNDYSDEVYVKPHVFLQVVIHKQRKGELEDNIVYHEDGWYSIAAGGYWLTTYVKNNGGDGRD